MFFLQFHSYYFTFHTNELPLVPKGSGDNSMKFSYAYKSSYSTGSRFGVKSKPTLTFLESSGIVN